MKEETNLWLKKAQEDLLAVTILLQREDSPPAIICFHCQQAAEKFIKALLVEKGIDFPRTHDLTLLVENYLLRLDSAFNNLLKPAINLNEFSIITRYPDDPDEIDITVARGSYNDVLFIESIISKELK